MCGVNNTQTVFQAKPILNWLMAMETFSMIIQWKLYKKAMWTLPCLPSWCRNTRRRLAHTEESVTVRRVNHFKDVSSVWLAPLITPFIYVPFKIGHVQLTHTILGDRNIYLKKKRFYCDRQITSIYLLTVVPSHCVLVVPSYSISCCLKIHGKQYFHCIKTLKNFSVHYGPNAVFVGLYNTRPHHHRYVDLWEGIEHNECWSFCRMFVYD